MARKRVGRNDADPIRNFWKTHGIAAILTAVAVIAAAVIGAVALMHQHDPAAAALHNQTSALPTLTPAGSPPSNPSVAATSTSTTVANCQGASSGLPTPSYGTYVGQLSDGTSVTFVLHQPDAAGIVATSKNPDRTASLQYVGLDPTYGYDLKVTDRDYYIWVSFASDCHSLNVTKDSSNRTGKFTRQ
jgi:hypothetical protein